MVQKSDAELLREYVRGGAESAFAELVHRHTNLVYSCAVRQVGSADVASEITQNVFVGLARGARALVGKLAESASLAGWLCRTARNISLNHRRDEHRRHTRERQAMETLNEPVENAPDWGRLRPVLDDAMAGLGDADYDALVLRFYEDRDLKSVGQSLGVSDDAAQKRVTRALERLRELLSQRGITAGSGVLSALLTANAVEAAPAGLAVTISTAAAAGGIGAAKSIATATTVLAMTTLQKTIVTVSIAALASAGIYEAHRASQLRDQLGALQQQQAPLEGQIQHLQAGRDEANAKLLAMQNELENLKRSNAAMAARRVEERPAASKPAAVQTAVVPAANPKPATTRLPKASWTDAGFATPESALKTRGWAVLNGDRARFADSLSITPGARKLVEDMIVKMASASTDPDRDKMIAEAIKNKWGVEEAMLMPMMALNQEKGFAGYQILSQESPTPDMAILEVETEMNSGPAQKETLKLRRIGNDWKVFIDEDFVKSMH